MTSIYVVVALVSITVQALISLRHSVAPKRILYRNECIMAITHSHD